MAKAEASVEELVGMIERGELHLPFTVLRRLTCVLEPTNKAILNEINETRISWNQPGPLPAEEVHDTFECFSI